MKPITNILLLITLVAYVFLPLFEISLVGNLTGLQFTESMITANLGPWYTMFSLMPFITIFLAIGFNCLKNRYWGIVVALLIFVVIYFFASLTNVFQGFSLVHDPEVAADTELSEGLPIVGVGIGFYVSLIFTVLAFISALVSLMPFKFNKKLEETIDSHIGKSFESSKKHISKVGHGIHDEFHKIGKHKQPKGAEGPVQPTAQESTVKNESDAVAEAPINREDDSRFMPQQPSDDEKYSDYMPK